MKGVRQLIGTIVWRCGLLPDEIAEGPCFVPQRPLVLLVEDNPGDIALVERTFVECGIDATLVSTDNAVKAFSYLGRQGPYRNEILPDLVLLDLNLPVIDGKTALGIIRREEAWRKVEVIVLTSSTRESDRDACRALGAEAYHVKPTVWSEFLNLGNVIKRRLADHRRRQDRDVAPGIPRPA